MREAVGRVVTDLWLTGTDFLRTLQQARKMREVQSRNFDEYTKTFKPEIITKWEQKIHEWEKDPSKPDPYEEATTRKHILSMLIVVMLTPLSSIYEAYQIGALS